MSFERYVSEEPLGDTLIQFLETWQQSNYEVAHHGVVSDETKEDYDRLRTLLNSVTLKFERKHPNDLAAYALSEERQWEMEQEQARRVALGLEEPEQPAW